MKKQLEKLGKAIVLCLCVMSMGFTASGETPEDLSYERLKEVLSGTPTHAAVHVDKLVYDLFDEGMVASLIGCPQTIYDPIIPSKVVYEGKTYKVVAVGGGKRIPLLYGLQGITIFPNTIRIIGDYAFCCCHKANSGYDFPESLEEKSEKAFKW